MALNFLVWMVSPAARAVNLDLSSTAATMAAPSRVTGSTVVNINVGGQNVQVTQGSLLTPAERVAVYQVLATGHQAIQLGNLGNAVGGSLTIGGNFSQHISGLVIPHGVTAIFNATNAALNLSGNLANSGTLYALSTSHSTTTASISAADITNARGALISTVLPAGGLPGFAGALPDLSLSLTAVHNIINAGVIRSAGSLALNAGGSIVNALPAGAAGPPPVMEAMNAINMTSGAGNIVNSGAISAGTNINLASQATASLLINNLGGTLQAVNGAINVRDALFAGGASSTLSGGDVAARELNLYSGSGTASVNVNNLDALLNVTAGEAHVMTASGTLHLGNMRLSGDPTILDNGGDVQITGDLNFSGQDLSIVASHDILAESGAGVISTNGATAGNILMVAGAQYTNDNTTVTISQGSSTGGKIDLVTGAAITQLSATGTTSGGNIQLVAFHGSDSSSGAILLPAGVTVDASGGAGGTNGTISMIAGAPSGTAIQTGNLSTAGSGSGGQISLANATPTLPNGNVTIDFNSGRVTGGSFAPATTAQGGTIVFAETNASLTSNSVSLLGNSSASNLTVGATTFTTSGQVTATGNVSVAPNTDQNFNVGASGSLIDAASIANISAPNLIIGKAAFTGGITLSSDITLSTGGPQLLTFQTGGNFTANSHALSLGSNNLTIDAGGSATTGAITAGTVNITAGANITAGGSINATSLTMTAGGALTSQGALTTTTGDINLTSAGQMNISGAVTSGGNLGLQTTGSASDILIGNTIKASGTVTASATRDIFAPNQIQATISASGTPWQFLLGATPSKDGSLLYVPDYNLGIVAVISTATNQQVGTISGFSQPQGTALSPDGSTLYVANFQTHSVSVVSLSGTGGSILSSATVSGGAESVALSKDGSRLYVLSDINSSPGTAGQAVFTVYNVSNPATPTLVTSINLGTNLAQTGGVAVNSTGTLAYVSNSGTRNIYVIDLTTNTVKSIIDLSHIGTAQQPQNPMFLAMDPNGTRLYVAEAFLNRSSTLTATGSISIIDTAANSPTFDQLLSNVSLGSGGFNSGARFPQGIAVSATNLEVFAQETYDSVMSSMSTTSSAVTNIATGQGPDGFGSSAFSTIISLQGVPTQATYTSNTINLSGPQNTISVVVKPTIESTSISLTAGRNINVNYDASGGTISAQATSGNVFLGNVGTTASSVGASSASTTSGIFQIGSLGSLTTTGAVKGNTVQLETTANNGAIALGGDVGVAGGTVKLIANGSGNITQSAGSILGSTATLISGSGNLGTGTGTGNALSVSASQVSTLTSGNVFLTSPGAITVAASTAGGTFNLNSGGAISASGTITAGNVVLQAAGDIGGSSSGSAAQLMTGTLAANTSSGSVVVTNGSALTLASSGAPGNFNLTAAGGLTVSGALTAGQLTLATTGSGSVELDAAVQGTNSVSITTAGSGGFIISSSNTLSSTGTISITAASLQINGSINAGATGSVQLIPNANGTRIDVGGSGAGSTFVISSSALASITASELIVGSTTASGGIQLAGALDVSATSGPGVYDLTFENTGAFNAGSNAITLGNRNLTLAAGSTILGQVTGGTGTITLQTDSLTLNSTISASGGTVKVGALTAVPIAVGTAAAGSLSVTSAMLSSITAGTLQIGLHTNTGGITVNSDVNLSAFTNAVFKNAGDIVLGGNITDSTGNLTITASGTGKISDPNGSKTLTASTISLASDQGNIGDSQAMIQINAPSLTVQSTSGSAFIQDAANLNLGASSVGGALNLVVNVASGSFTDSAAVTAGSMSVTADSIAISSSASITTTGTTTFAPFTDAPISIGTGLFVDGSSIARVTAPQLIVGGSALTHTIAISSNIDLTGSNLQQLTFQTAGDYNGGGGTVSITLGSTNLFINAGGNVTAGTINGDGRTITISGNAVTTDQAIADNNGTLSLAADSSFTFTVVPATAGGTVQLSARTDTNPIYVGGTSAPAGVLIDNAKLSTFTASTLTIGSATNSGGIVINANLDLSGSQVGTYVFENTGAFSTTSSSQPHTLTLGANNLTIQAASVDLSGNISGGSTIAIKTNSLTLETGVQINSPGSSVSIDSLVPMPIVIGGPGAGGTLVLGSAILNNITTGTLTIGSTANTGGMTVSLSTTSALPYNLVLNNGGNFSQTSGSLNIGARSLTIDALGTVSTGIIIGSSGSGLTISGAGISLTGNILASTAQLTATGSGTISEAAGKLLSAGTTTLASATGNIGSADTALSLDVNQLGISTTGSAASVFISNDKALTLGQTSVPGSLTVSAAGNLTAGSATNTVTAGTLTLQTTGSNGNVRVSGTTTATAAAGLTIATNGSGALILDSGVTLSATGTTAPISISAASLSLSGSISATGTVTLAPNTSNTGQQISVGGASGPAGSFAITNAALGAITTTGLIVGNSGLTGGVILAGAVDVSGSGAGAYDLTFNNQGTFNGNGQTIALGDRSLTINAGSSVTTGGIAGNNATVSVTGTALTLAGSINLGGASSTATLTTVTGGTGNISDSGTITVAAGSLIQMTTTAGGQLNFASPDTLTVGAGGTIHLVTNNLSLVNTTINATATGTVKIENASASPIQVGGTAATGALTVSSTTLNNITAGTLIVGTTSLGGGITLGADLNVSGSGAGAYNLIFNNSSAINTGAHAITLGASALTINTAGSVTSGAVAGSGTLTISGSSILLNNNITVGQANLTASGSGTITEASGKSLTASSVALTSGTGNIGTQSTPFSLNAGSLTVNSSASAFVANGSALTLAASAVTGTLNVSAAGNLTVSAGTNSVSAANLVLATTAGGGNVEISSSASGSQSVTVTTNGAGALIIDSGASLGSSTAASVSVTSASLSLSGTIESGGSVTLAPNSNVQIAVGGLGPNPGTFRIDDVSLSKVIAPQLIVGTPTNTGGILIAEALDVSGAGVGTYNLIFQNGGVFQGNGQTINLGSQTLTISTTNDVHTPVISGGNTTVTISGGGVDVAGAIDLTGTTSSLSIGTVSGGTGSLSGISTSGSLAANTIALSTGAGTNAPISLGGDIGSSSSTVTINANGSGTITQSGGVVTASGLTLTSGSGAIGNGATQAIAVTTTNLSVNTAGSAFLHSEGSVTLGASSVGGTYQLLSDSSISGNGTIKAGAVIFSATSGNVGQSPTSPLLLSTPAITANSQTASVFLSDATGATLRSATGPVANGALGTFSVVTAGLLTVSDSINAGTLQLSTAGNGSINVAASLNTSGSGSTTLSAAGTGSISLSGNIVVGSINSATSLTTAGTGSITQTGGAVISGVSLGLATGGGNIGSPLNAIQTTLTTAGNLTIAAGGSGSAFVSSTGSISLGASHAGNTLKVTDSGTSALLAVTGAITAPNITLQSLAGTNGISLNSTVGSASSNTTIIANSGNITNVSGSVLGAAVTLTSVSGSIGAATSPATAIATQTGRLSINTGAGSAFVSNTGAVTVSGSAASVFSLTNNGSITTAANIPAADVRLLTNLPAGGTGSSIFMNNSLGTSNGSVTLRASGTGAIVEAPTANFLASTVTLNSTSGSIGSSTAPIRLVSGSVTVNTTGPVFLSASGMLTVTTTGTSLQVGGISAPSVTILLTGTTSATMAPGGVITTPALTLNGAAGAFGTNTTPLKTSAASLSATTTSSNVFVSTTGPVALGTSNVGGTLSVQAAGTISPATASTEITAGSLTLKTSSGSIGAQASAPLTVSTGSLTASASSIFVTSPTALAIGASAASAMFQASAPSITVTGSITAPTLALTATGAGGMSVQAVVGTGTGNTTLSATGGGNIVTTAQGLVAGSTVNLSTSGGAIGSGAGLQTRAATVNLVDTSASPTDANISNTGALNLSSASTWRILNVTASGQLTVKSALNANQITLETTGNSNVVLTATPNVASGTLNPSLLISAGGTGTITEGSGVILGGAGVLTTLQSASGNLGSATAPIRVGGGTGAQIDVTTGGKGNAFVSAASGSLAIGNSSAATLQITTNGSISIAGTVGSSTGTTIITAGGSNAITEGAGGVVQGSRVTLTSGSVSTTGGTGGSIGASDAPISVNASSLTVGTGGASANIFINSTNTNGLTLNNSFAGAGFAGTGTFSLTSAGTISLNGNIVAGSVTLSTASTPSSGIQLGAALIVANTGNINILSGTNGSISQTTSGQLITLGNGGTVVLNGAGGDIGSSTSPVSTSTSFLSVSTSGLGSAFVANSAAGPLTVQAAQAGGTLSITHTGSITFDPNSGTYGDVTGTNIIIKAVTGSDGSITLPRNVTAAGDNASITIVADGSGAITGTATQTGTLTAPTVTLTSSSGDIGGTNPLQTQAGTLIVNTAGTGSVNIQQTGDVTISNSGAGKSFTLIGSGAVQVGNVATFAGDLTIESAAGQLSVLPASGVSASGGNLTLWSTDTANGSILIGAGSNLTASAASPSDPSTGNVYIQVSASAPPPPQINPTTPPPHVVVAGTQTQVFFGQNSITGNLPNNTVTSNSRYVIFDRPASASTPITLNGNVFITASSEPLLTSLDLSNHAVAVFVKSLPGNSGLIVGATGGATGGSATLFPSELAGRLSAVNIPASVKLNLDDFQSTNPIFVVINSSSTTRQMLVNGTLAFGVQSAASTSGNITIQTNQTLPALQVGGTGRITSTDGLSLTANGGILINGPVTAKTLTIATNGGSNASIQLGASVGQPGGTSSAPTTTTLSADGLGNITQTSGSVFGFNVNLSSGGGNIGTSPTKLLNVTSTNLTAVSEVSSTDPGTGSVFISNTSPTGSPTFLGQSLSGSTFWLQTSGSLTTTAQVGAVGTQTFVSNLALIAGSAAATAASITLGASVSGATEVVLVARGTGTISQTGGTIFGGSLLTMSSGTGDLGAAQSPLQISADTLSATTKGNVFVQDAFAGSSGTLTVQGPSSAGATFSVNAAVAGIAVVGSLSASTINLTAGGNIDTSSGTLAAINSVSLQAEGTSLSVIGPINVTAGNGSVNISAPSGPVATSGVVKATQVSLQAGGIDSTLDPQHPFAINLAANIGGAGTSSATTITSTVAGNIVQAAGQVLGNTVTVSSAGGSIGLENGTSIGDYLHVTTANLTATTSGTGGVFIVNTGAVNLAASSAGGKFFVLSNSGITTSGDISAGADVLLQAGAFTNNGGLTLNGNISGSNTVNLKAAGAGAITQASGKQITISGAGGGSLFITAGSGAVGTNSAPITANPTTVAATAIGNVFIKDTASSAVTLQASSGSTFQLLSAAPLTVSGSIPAATVTLQTTSGDSGITLGTNSAAAVLGKSGAIVTLTTSGAGAITAATGASGAIAKTLNLVSATGNIGTSSTAGFNFLAGTISTQTSGDVFLNSEGSASTAIGSSTANNFNLAAIGPVTQAASTNVQAQSLAITTTRGDIGTSAQAITTSASTVSFSGAASSNVFLLDTQTAGVTVSSTATGALKSIQISGTGNITTNSNLTANTVLLQTTANGASITLNGNLGMATGTTTVLANGSGSISQQAGTILGTTISLTSGSGSIGSAASPVQVGTTKLSAQTSTTGDIFVSSLGPLTVASATGGSSGEVQIASSGVLSVAGPVAGASIVLQAIGNSNLSLAGNVGTASTSSVTLLADNNGSILQTSGTVTGANITMATDFGNIGTATTAIKTVDSGTLTARTASQPGMTGGVFVSNTGAVSLVGSSAGSALNVTSSAGLTLTNDASDNPAVSVGNGSALLIAQSGNLTVQSGSSLNIVGGNLTLQDNNTTSGQIQIQAGATINTQSLTPGQGVVTVTIGPPPASPVSGHAPPGVTVQTAQGGQVFFGANGISAGTGITVSATATNVIFNGGSRSNAIQLGSNSSITADPPQSMIALLPGSAAQAPATLAAKPAQAAPAVNGLWQPTTAGQAVGGAPAYTAAAPGPNTIIPTTAAVSLPSASASCQSCPASASRQARVEADGNDLIDADVFVDSADEPARRVSERQSDLQEIAYTERAVPGATSLLMPRRAIDKMVTGGVLHTDRGAVVFVVDDGTTTAIFNLHDCNLGDVTFAAGDRQVTLAPGQALVISSKRAGFESLNPVRAAAYRNVHECSLPGSFTCYRAEFAPLSLITHVIPLRDLLSDNSPQKRRCRDTLLKTAAILNTHMAGGPYRRLAAHSL